MQEKSHSAMEFTVESRAGPVETRTSTRVFSCVEYSSGVIVPIEYSS